MDSPTLALVKDKVARYLEDLAPTGFRTLPNGLMELERGAAVISVGVAALDREFTRVEVATVVLRHVRPTDELCRYIVRVGATHHFGRYELHSSDVPNAVDVHFRHDLLGDYLDREELSHAIAAVAGGAASCTELQRRFGGERAYATS